MSGARFVRSILALAVAGATLSSCAANNFRPDYDPLESVNRKVFWFNDKVDQYVLEPMATGWDWVLPNAVQRAIANFYLNLRFPIITINDLLQGKLKDGASDVGRFAVNTTVGVLGFFDPASSWGLQAHLEDFGQTLGVWGIPPGAYLVLPLLGPSNPRDTAGLATDYGLSIFPFFVNQFALLGVRGIDLVNARAQVLEQVRDAKGASLDFYTFVRNAYFQRRKALVRDSTEVRVENGEDIYQLDEDLVE